MERLRRDWLCRDKRLAPRELEVLRAAAAGWSTERTGRELLIGFETVKTYRQQLLAKLAARNMTQAVAIAYQRGILE